MVLDNCKQVLDKSFSGVSAESSLLFLPHLRLLVKSALSNDHLLQVLEIIDHSVDGFLLCVLVLQQDPKELGFVPTR